MKTKRIIFIGVGLFAGALLFLGLMSFSRGEQPGVKPVFADNSPAVRLPEGGLAVAEALQDAFRSVSDAVLPAVVEIDVVETKTIEASPFDSLPFFFFGTPKQEERKREFSQQGLGSGVIVRRTDNTYYVLTNDHVAGSATEISVKLYDGREFKGKLVGTDQRRDIALVSFESKDTISVAKLGDSDKVRTGDIVIAMGTPLGYFASVTQGIVSATGRSGNGIRNINDFIQTDAAINQGNSGGPLVNIYGEVIGINTWIASQSGGSQGLGFAIPVNNVKKAIDDFITKGKVSYGWMGVSLVEIQEEYRRELSVGGKKGAFVSQIFLDSPAAKSGIQAGDYITALNGKTVMNVDQLVREVGDLRAGENADFELIRGGKSIKVTVKIEARSEKTTSDNSKLWPGFIAVPLSTDVRKELKIEDKKVQGVVVTNIYAKSPAAALRLQSGDIITSVNDKKVSNLAEFYSALNTQNNKSIWFEVYSDGHFISTGKYKF
ncbi:Do family serine endopeptidase [Treponema sp. OMZ 840]|uniref:Do family serine endopeptidase n=1 Tax=Treponema sp. OMZ 840 TaxID=244313 RepID=UPI003D902BD9